MLCDIKMTHQLMDEASHVVEELFRNYGQSSLAQQEHYIEGMSRTTPHMLALVIGLRAGFACKEGLYNYRD